MAKTKQRSDTSSKAKFNEKPKKPKKDAGKGVYLGVEHDSYEELCFLYWAEELKKQGYIISVERSESFLLCDALTNNYAEQLKTKSKPVNQLLSHGHSYTPEFKIIWNYKKARDKFVWLIGSGSKFDKFFIAHKNHGDTDTCYTYIEVKPPFDYANMTRLAKINIKWVYQKYGIYVNLCVPQELFKKTFVPRKFLITSTGKAKKINFKQTTMFEYLNSNK